MGALELESRVSELDMADEDQSLKDLKQKIQAERGFHCELYKDKCLRRRLGVRMRARGLESFGDYSRLLDEDVAEYDRLIDTLTINVTKFFRNPDLWDALRADVVPALFEAPGTVRIWSAGCASGEEAYSVSILMHEWSEAVGRESEVERVEILGTDIDRRSLVTAAEAVFPPLSFEDTPPEVRARWFSETPPYHLDPRVRSLVRFKRSDLMAEIPRGPFRMILCRNVLIYFDRVAQERLFESFYEALEPGGYLVLGRVETLLGRPRSLFRAVRVKDRIFQKRA